MPEGMDSTRLNFLKLLVLRRRTQLISQMRQDFEALVDEAEGRTEVELTVAVELSAEERQKLEAVLSEKSGSEVRVDVSSRPRHPGRRHRSPRRPMSPTAASAVASRKCARNS